MAKTTVSILGGTADLVFLDLGVLGSVVCNTAILDQHYALMEWCGIGSGSLPWSGPKGDDQEFGARTGNSPPIAVLRDLKRRQGRNDRCTGVKDEQYESSSSGASEGPRKGQASSAYSTLRLGGLTREPPSWVAY